MVSSGEVLDRSIPQILKIIGAKSLVELSSIFREDWVAFVKAYPQEAGDLISELITERIQEDEQVELSNELDTKTNPDSK